MSVGKIESNFENSATDFSIDIMLNKLKSHIGELLGKNQQEALQYLYNVSEPLKEDKQYEKKFMLEFFYLMQLAKSSYSQKISHFYSAFLLEMLELVGDKLNDPKYLNNFSKFLLTETNDLGDILAKKNYQKAIEIYNSAIEIFLKFGINYANWFSIRKGELLTENKQFDKALRAYKEVFLNLYRLHNIKNYQPVLDVEFHQIINSLERIVDENKREPHSIYATLLKILKEKKEVSLAEIKEETIKIKDYNIYLNLSYILSYLNFVCKIPNNNFREFPLSENLKKEFASQETADFITYLKEETSIFLAIDKGEQKLEELLKAKIPLDVIGLNNTTPLQYAVSKRNKACASLLLSRGRVKVDEYIPAPKYPPPPVYLAISNGDKELLLILLDARPNLNPSISATQVSPLFYAISKGKEEIAETLISYGARLRNDETKRLEDTTYKNHSLYMRLFRKNTPLKLHLLKNNADMSHLLVPISGNDQSVKTPIFCPHAIDGEGGRAYLNFAKAVNSIEADRPVYGINSPMLTDGNHPDTIEDIATLYIQAIKSRQSLGPYVLFGWSFGGLLVYEIARQLMDLGEEVIIVGIFDTRAPRAMIKMSNSEYAEYLLDAMKKGKLDLLTGINLDKLPNKEQLSLLDKVKQIDVVLREPYRSKLKSEMKPLNSLLDTYHAKLVSEKTPVSEKAVNALVSERALDALMQEKAQKRQKAAELVATNMLAALKYNPPISCKNPFVTCFNSEESCQKNGDLDLGWEEQTAGNLVVRVAPGTHFSILKDKVLVDKIAKFICNHKLLRGADLYKKCCFDLVTIQLYDRISKQYQRNKEQYYLLTGQEIDITQNLPKQEVKPLKYPKFFPPTKTSLDSPDIRHQAPRPDNNNFTL